MNAWSWTEEHFININPVRLSLKVSVSNLAPTDLYHRGS